MNITRNLKPLWSYRLEFGTAVGVLADATHLSDEDPDQPQSSGEEDEDEIEDEVSETIAAGHRGSFRSGGSHYNACFYRENL